MKIQELKKNSPAQLIEQAEKLGIENASTLRKQEILFAILKKLAQKGEEITCDYGFGFDKLDYWANGFGGGSDLSIDQKGFYPKLTFTIGMNLGEL